MDEAIRLEHDTAGIPGTPDIASTIFAKIRDAGVFVADLTLLPHTGSGKRSPNPNVLIELGYAFSAGYLRRIYGQIWINAGLHALC